jgi:GcrA cell cycle regulator
LTLNSEYQKLEWRRATTKQVKIMEPVKWAPEHSDALREHLAKNISFSEIVKAINSRFNTAYTRNAALGRARRMAALAGSDQPKAALPSRPPRLFEPSATDLKSIERQSRKLSRKKAKMPKLRCAEIEPRHLSLIELERNDCRYPYGGDREGEAVTFCGHPRRPGSSYCTPHFHLSRNPVEPTEGATGGIWLRIVEAA